MKDEFVEIKLHRIHLILTRDEFLRALRRGRITKKNRKAARERRRSMEIESAEQK